jgi:hypothetical protein
MCALLRHRIQRSELTLDDRGYTHVDNVITWLKEKNSITTSGTENVLISTSDPDVKLLMDHLSSVKQAKQDRTEASKKNPNWSNYCPYHCESGFSEVAARMNDPSTSNVFKQMFRTQFPHYK